MECEPGQRPTQPELAEIEDGDGKGQRLLPLDAHQLARGHRPGQQHHAPALPRAVLDPASASSAPASPAAARSSTRSIHRANPALRETDRVLEDPRAAEPGAGRPRARLRRRRSRRSRARGSGSPSFIVQANATGEATAERRADIEASIEQLARASCASCGRRWPTSAASPTQAAPVVARPQRAGRRRQPHDPGARPVLDARRSGSLDEPRRGARGRAARRCCDARPLVEGPARLRRRTRARSRRTWTSSRRASTRPAASSALMDFLFFSMLAVNGYDGSATTCAPACSSNLCTAYAVEPAGGCSAQLHRGQGRRVGRVEDDRRTPTPGSPTEPAPRRRKPRAACAPHGQRSSAASSARAETQRGQAERRADPARARAGRSPRAPGQRRADARLPPGERRVSRRGGTGRASPRSPVLVGAVTLLVAIVAVFLSYNANAGLPFVPTYDLKAELPNAANLVGQRGPDRRRAGGRDRRDHAGAERRRRAHARCSTSSSTSRSSRCRSTPR